MRQDQKAQVKDYDAKLSEHSLAKRKILLFIVRRQTKLDTSAPLRRDTSERMAA